jgi:hypothetical protein
MKRGAFCFFIIFSFIGMNVSAVELWNGFTTDMTRNNVIARAREILRTSEEDLNYNGWNNATFGFGQYLFKEIQEKFPAHESCISFKSILPAYEQSRGKNIHFFFIGGKLFAVHIIWTVTGNELLEATISQYGNYDYSVSAITDLANYYNWKVTGKLIYIRNSIFGDPVGYLYIIDRQIVEKFTLEQNLIIETERRQAVEGITF